MPLSVHVQERYFIDGFEIRFRGFGFNVLGEAECQFHVFREDGKLMDCVAVQSSRLRRREDVTFEVKKRLGLLDPPVGVGDAPVVEKTGEEG